MQLVPAALSVCRKVIQNILRCERRLLASYRITWGCKAVHGAPRMSATVTRLEISNFVLNMESVTVSYHQIRATYNDESIVVYQAYNPTIADAAIRAQTLNIYRPSDTNE
jgi:hypothetical protein